jgi:hypothetical protein
MSISLITFKENYKSVSGSLTEFQWTGIASIIEAWEGEGHLTDLRQLAYILATIKHETANTFRPIEEYGKGKGRPYYNEVNGHRYFGRGYIQLTWLDNYKRMTKRLNDAGIKCDLVNNPEQALDWNIAIAITFIGMDEGLFTGKKLRDYFNEYDENPVEARKIINGKDRAKLVAEYYYEFNKALSAARNH